MPQYMQHFERLSQKIYNFQDFGSNSSLNFEARWLLFFILSSMWLFINANAKILNFGLQLFYSEFLAKVFKKQKFYIFEHYEETKMKFKILILAFVKEGILIRLKTELSSFKAVFLFLIFVYYANLRTIDLSPCLYKLTEIKSLLKSRLTSLIIRILL